MTRFWLFLLARHVAQAALQKSAVWAAQRAIKMGDAERRAWEDDAETRTIGMTLRQENYGVVASADGRHAGVFRDAKLEDMTYFVQVQKQPEWGEDEVPSPDTVTALRATRAQYEEAKRTERAVIEQGKRFAAEHAPPKGWRPL